MTATNASHDRLNNLDLLAFLYNELAYTIPTDVHLTLDALQITQERMEIFQRKFGYS